MRSTKFCLAILGLSVGYICPSNAESKLSADHFYVRAGLGGIKHSKFKNTSVVSIQKAPKGTWVSKVGAGYKYNKFVRADLTYQYAGLIYKAENFRQTMHTNSVFVNAYWDINYFTHFVPYLTGGIGVGFNRAGCLSGPMSVCEEGESKTNFIWNVGAGAKYDFNKNYAVDLEYRFVNLGKISTKSTKVLNTMIAPTNQTIRGHQFVVSFIYTFSK